MLVPVLITKPSWVVVLLVAGTISLAAPNTILARNIGNNKDSGAHQNRIIESYKEGGDRKQCSERAKREKKGSGDSL